MKNFEVLANEVLRTKNGELKNNAYAVYSLLLHEQKLHNGQAIYLITPNGYKNGASVNLRTIQEYLCKLGVFYGFKNDAPRGGKNGNYIEITKDARNKLARWSNKERAKMLQIQTEYNNKQIEIAAAKEREISACIGAIKLHKDKVMQIVNKHGNNNKGLRTSAWKLSSRNGELATFQIFDVKIIFLALDLYINNK